LLYYKWYVGLCDTKLLYYKWYVGLCDTMLLYYKWYVGLCDTKLLYYKWYVGLCDTKLLYYKWYVGPLDNCVALLQVICWPMRLLYCYITGDLLAHMITMLLYYRWLFCYITGDILLYYRWLFCYITGDLLAHEITMSDNDRIALMQMVKEGKISTETALQVVSGLLSYFFWKVVEYAMKSLYSSLFSSAHKPIYLAYL